MDLLVGDIPGCPLAPRMARKVAARALACPGEALLVATLALEGRYGPVRGVNSHEAVIIFIRARVIRPRSGKFNDARAIFYNGLGYIFISLCQLFSLIS